MEFKLPYTDFNEINLDWLLKTVRDMEPAVGMISEAEAALEQANSVAAQASQTATDAANAVSSVTALATAADAKADQAIAIAQQAAAATIADGSVTYEKLGPDVQQLLTDIETTAGAAQTTAASAQTQVNNAVTIANSAAQTAGDAQQAAAAAAQAAAAADAKADQALEMGFANWTRYANIGGSGLSLPHEIDTPVAKEYLVVFYTSQTANRRMTMTIPYAALALGTNYYWCEISGIVAAVKADANKFLFDDTSPLGAAVIYIR